MVHSNYLLSNLFFKDNCCLFFNFVDIFFLISSNSKSVLFKLIVDLLDIATSAEWTLIFKEAIRTDENKFLKNEIKIKQDNEIFKRKKKDKSYVFV